MIPEHLSVVGAFTLSRQKLPNGFRSGQKLQAKITFAFLPLENREKESYSVITSLSVG